MLLLLPIEKKKQHNELALASLPKEAPAAVLVIVKSLTRAGIINLSQLRGRDKGAEVESENP